MRLIIPKIFNSSEKRNKFNSNESFFTRGFVWGEESCYGSQTDIYRKNGP